jgi:ribose 5-phosphate isomerase A
VCAVPDAAEDDDLPLGLRWGSEISNREAKEAIGAQVAQRAADGQVIGAGSGTTSFLTVVALGRRAQAEGLEITVVPTSIEIALAAEAVGLHVSAVVPDIVHWCFDGADEVDPDDRLIKGRGGALLRERVVFASADHRLLVADDSKSVERLGSGFPVPIEVQPAWVRRAHQEIGRFEHVDEVTMRMAGGKDGPVVTEGGNVLLDATFSTITADHAAAMLATPGVLGTGVFSGFEFERLR